MLADEETNDVEESEELAEDSKGESAEQADAAKASKFSRLKKPLLLLLIVLVQVAAAYAVAQFLILPRLPGADDGADSTAVEVAIEEEAPERGSIVVMDDVVVNLQDDGGSRFLKVTAGLEFKDKELEQEIAERMPELRDLLIDHLSSHEVEDVVHREGREVVKKRLLDDFNDRLQQGQLLNVYFSDFVVQ